MNKKPAKTFLHFITPIKMTYILYKSGVYWYWEEDDRRIAEGTWGPTWASAKQVHQINNKEREVGEGTIHIIFLFSNYISENLNFFALFFRPHPPSTPLFHSRTSKYNCIIWFRSHYQWKINWIVIFILPWSESRKWKYINQNIENDTFGL